MKNDITIEEGKAFVDSEVRRWGEEKNIAVEIEWKEIVPGEHQIIVKAGN